MTKLLENILNEPGELAKSLAHALGAGRAGLERAGALLREARHLYITGIGSSWHAGMAVQSLCDAAGRPAQLVDASELLHGVRIAEGSVVLALSRSGRSVEIVALLDKAQAAGARVIGVTNTPESPLAKRAEVVLPLQAAFDHNISITMYSALTLVGGLAVRAAAGTLDEALAAGLKRALAGAGALLPDWRRRIEASPWFAKDAPVYFLARGGSMASASETRLLWEEAAKAPACAMTTGGFRHGPQEITAAGLRVGLWVDAERLHREDLALAADVRHFGAAVLLIGAGLPEDAGDLVLPVPAAPPGWQFLVDALPAQLAAERQARLRGVDCDSFRICPYIIEAEGGIRGAGGARA